ncbi:uncharacterized protein NECHADRAFT_48840 [Fusarium vanettenii 77-13-4]|uniref:GAR domain-containing protein n=1 Tax=Fusarium vanettenii (strain ATCC MYA-4622 / CBS 123669 / FGSC 9596 / NRRL 45880 / 77-13-4) TaxID=660122 RepID=C7YTX3_FUSV7|nr:uncharacterized protein NECHADRAFT_48840 [Fusarium vanettenii 77-13-4]EEU44320.1 hypothetical protein NECHADRAFT_48840 [Fusarium vanettenii 77-13-4]
MSDPPTQVIRHARHPTATSPPPKNRLTDDILANLGPRTVVDALNTATGALRACLTNSSTTERDFLLRTASASKAIWSWVDELQNWPWPTESSSAGFEMPSEKERKRKSMQLTVPDGDHDGYMGSLLAREVTKYERRLVEIQRDLDDLEIEDIKAHVLNNHILPLSRPGTPLTEFTRVGQLSSSSYNRMEDLTAVITAIVVQALPNLAKVTRLLHSWGLRLTVLRQVPPLLIAIEDAEVALKSGWNAVSLPSAQTPQTYNKVSPREPTLTRNNFEVMKGMLEKQISRPGRSLDYMLDCLEGLNDTLPDDWLDRMTAVEQGYVEWVTVCERKVRETEWAAAAARLQPPRSPSPLKKLVDVDDSTVYGETLVADDSSSDAESTADANEGLAPIPLLLPRKNGTVAEPQKSRMASGASEAETVVPDSITRDVSSESEPDSPSFNITGEFAEPSQDLTGSFDGTREMSSPLGAAQPPTPTTEHHFSSSLVHTPETPNRHFPQDFDLDESPDLPPLRPIPFARPRTSFARDLTVTRRSSSHFDGLSSDPPEISASPDLPRTRIREAEYIQASPPSSPPMRVADSRESSMPPFGSPLLGPNRSIDDLNLSINAIDDSFTDDFDDEISIYEYTGPFDRRGSTGDQQLQQQISQIIESIPAKIKLSTELPKVNLNPPDLQLPRVRKRPSVEPFRRSASNLSSRAGTPSFTLSPAKNARVRNRGQQEIKVYHLSRSTGEAPIKLFIRCVGEQGERVMVRVGGGWADLGEYLKEYANHHKRRSAGASNAKVEVLPDVPVTRRSNFGSSPTSRPHSALEMSPMSPLAVRKTRRSVGAMSSEVPRLHPRTPAVAPVQGEDGPSSEESNRSRSSSRLSWGEDESSFLGLAGPSGKKVEMSEENKAWVESVKEKVRIASGERKISSSSQFGELGKVGGTKRLFKRTEDRRQSRGSLR